MFIIWQLMYPTSPANLVVEVGAMHSHQIFLFSFKNGPVNFMKSDYPKFLQWSLFEKLQTRSQLTISTIEGYISCDCFPVSFFSVIHWQKSKKWAKFSDLEKEALVGAMEAAWPRLRGRLCSTLSANEKTKEWMKVADVSGECHDEPYDWQNSVVTNDVMEYAFTMTGCMLSRQYCPKMAARSPNATHKWNGQPIFAPWVVRFAINKFPTEFLQFNNCM